MFKVYDTIHKAVVTVYGVREYNTSTYFLLYSFGVWHWVSADDYKPMAD